MCIVVDSLFRTVCSFTFVTNLFPTGTNQSEGILGSSPNIVYQIRHTYGHSAVTCPHRYSSQPQSVLPAYVTFNPAAIDEQVYYPNSAVASHMTPDDDNLISKTVYSDKALLKVGDGTLHLDCACWSL